MKQNLLFWCFLASTSIMAQRNNTEKIVSVTAKADKKVSPDEVLFSIDIRHKGTTFEEAINSLDHTISQAKNLLLKERIDKDKIRTTTYNVNKNYYWDNGKRKDDGYMATSRLEAKHKLDTKVINKVLKRFGKESPDLNLNVAFTISDDLLEKSKNELLRLAIKRAKSKAKNICYALDKELNDIKSVDYDESGCRPVYQKNFEAMNMRAAAVDEHAPIENVREMQLSLSVHTKWIID